MTRALPGIDDENAYFWRSGGSGRLQIMRCGNCRLWLHPPGPVCRRCRSRALAPEPVSGHASVSRFTVNHQQWRPDLDVPFVIASVELDEQPGLFVTTNIVDCEPGDVHRGMRVTVRFEPMDDVWLPLFTPDVKEHEA